jgi:plasmid maintenance system antidote protein VapI
VPELLRKFYKIFAAWVFKKTTQDVLLEGTRRFNPHPINTIHNNQIQTTSGRSSKTAKRPFFCSQQRKENMKPKKPQLKNEELDMYSACKLVNELMKRDGLTPDRMMRKSGMPAQFIVAILQGGLRITEGNALLFQRCFDWPAIQLLHAQLCDDLAMAAVQARMLKVILLCQEVLAQIENLRALVEKKH